MRQGELAARERHSFPDNHTAPVPQDLSRPWTTTTQHMDPREEACPPPPPPPRPPLHLHLQLSLHLASPE